MPPIVWRELLVLAGRDGRPWVALPSRPLLDSDGRARAGGDGKRRYEPVAEWLSRDVGAQFSAAVCTLIEEAHPGALNGGGGQ